MERDKIVIESVINSTVASLFAIISTKEGLEKWFAHEVTIDGDSYAFSWNKSSIQHATLISLKANKHICFQWDEDKETPYTFEMNISTTELASVVSIEVIDYAESSEVEDLKSIWDQNIKALKLNLGSL